MLERFCKWYLQRKMKKDSMYNYELVISTKEVALRNRLSEYINTKIGSLKQSVSENSNFSMWEWVSTEGIDNDKATFQELQEKLYEEVSEVTVALYNLSNEYKSENVNQALEEILDVGQVLIALIRNIRLKSKARGVKFDFKAAMDEHNFKATERKWKRGNCYEIQYRERN